MGDCEPISDVSKHDDNEEIIKRKLLVLIPFDMEKEKIQLKETNAAGSNQSEIKIFEIELKKDRHINEFLENLNNKLDIEQKELLIRQINSRLDNDLNFFIRLDKEKLLNDNLCITDSGNCFHIRIYLAAFPAKTIK